MQLFGELTDQGDFVVEVGGHIGYVSAYLATLAGPHGRVWVFEPAQANLSYLRSNVAAYTNVSIFELALSDRSGQADFYVEELTGQNNSLLSDYAVLNANEAEAYLDSEKRVVQVLCTTLDRLLTESNAPAPSLIKIDVEGAEYRVLQGMHSVLSAASPALMVEVTERPEEVLDYMRSLGFQAFDAYRKVVTNVAATDGNLFFVKESDPRRRLFATS